MRGEELTRSFTGDSVLVRWQKGGKRSIPMNWWA